MHHPFPAWPVWNLIYALYGTFFDNLSITISYAFDESKLGGNLKDNLTLVWLLTTFPAFAIGGNPSAPVMDKLALQTLFKYNSSKLSYSIT